MGIPAVQVRLGQSARAFGLVVSCLPSRGCQLTSGFARLERSNSYEQRDGGAFQWSIKRYHWREVTPLGPEFGESKYPQGARRE